MLDIKRELFAALGLLDARKASPSARPSSSNPTT
jgi:hypothetical protein